MATDDVTPILLRPPTWMAEAMTAAADDHGESRQAWMLRTLQDALAGVGYRRPRDTADDPALFDVAAQG